MEIQLLRDRARDHVRDHERENVSCIFQSVNMCETWFALCGPQGRMGAGQDSMEGTNWKEPSNPCKRG